MAYTTNPRLPLVRMEAVRLVKYRDWSTRQVARHTGYHQSTIVQWCKKDPTGGWQKIKTKSSRPHNHPRALSRELVEAIIAQRVKHRRCAEVVYQELVNQGVAISLSSVKRTLKRAKLLKERSPWKRYHPHIERPRAEKPGDLVQIDTIHILTREQERFYIYTLIDLCSRWAYAKVYARINTHNSLRFVRQAQKEAVFGFNMIQSDHGSEFSTWFTENLGKLEVNHRHSRVRQSNDNAHIERFNRTIQEECLDRIYKQPRYYQKAIDGYLPYYNTERLHLGIKLKTPAEMITSY